MPVPAVKLMPGMSHPVSFNEEQMLRLYVQEPLSMAYVLGGNIRCRVPLDVRSASRCQQLITDRHIVLRSAYRMDDIGNPHRKVSREHHGGQLIMVVRDEGDVQKVQAADSSVPTRLGVCGLRFNIELSHNSFSSVGMVMDHILGDADATATYWTECLGIQQGFSAGYTEEAVAAQLPHLPVSMVDYAYWQRSLVSRNLLDPDLTHWGSGILSAFPLAVLDVPIDVPRPRVWAVIGQQQKCTLDQELVAPLQELNTRATPFAIVIATFCIILGRLGRSPSIHMGTPFALRTLAAVQNLIGDFVNMVIFKVAHDPGEMYLSALARATTAAVDVQRYSMAPFLLLVNMITKYNPSKDPSRNAINQTMIDVVPNESEEPNVSMSGIFDFFLFANTRQGLLWSIEATYNTTILQLPTVKMMLLQMTSLVMCVSRDAKVPVPRELPARESVQCVGDGGLVLAHLRLRLGGLPHIVGVKSGWEAEGESPERKAIRAARRLKRQAGLEFSADLPLAGSRAQRPPKFIVVMEQQQHEATRRQQEVRDQRRREREDSRRAAQEAPALPGPAPAVEAVEAGETEQAGVEASATVATNGLLVVPEAESEAGDPAGDPLDQPKPMSERDEVLQMIEARRREIKRKLAARNAQKDRLAESEATIQLISLDPTKPAQGMRQRPRAAGGRR